MSITKERIIILFNDKSVYSLKNLRTEASIGLVESRKIMMMESVEEVFQYLSELGVTIVF